MFCFKTMTVNELFFSGSKFHIEIVHVVLKQK